MSAHTELYEKEERMCQRKIQSQSWNALSWDRQSAKMSVLIMQERESKSRHNMLPALFCDLIDICIIDVCVDRRVCAYRRMYFDSHACLVSFTEATPHTLHMLQDKSNIRTVKMHTLPVY